MDYLPVLASLYFTAAVLHAAIAAFVLAAGPRRLENWLIVLVLALAGGSSVARALRALAEPAERLTWDAVAVDLEWPISLFVLALALVYPRRRLRTRGARAAAGAVAAFFAAVWLVVILWKEPIYAVGPGQVTGATWTSAILDDVRYWVCTIVALGIFGREAAAPHPHDRSAELLFAAFAIGPLSTVVHYVAAAGGIPYASAVDTTRYAAGLLGAVVVVGLFAWVVHRGAKNGRVPAVLLGFGLAALASAVALRMLPFGVQSDVGLFGEMGYLFARPLLLGYALLKYQLVDVDIKAKHGFASLLLFLIVGAVFLPVEELVRRLPGMPPDLALPAGMAAGLAVSFVAYNKAVAVSQRASESLFRSVREEDTRFLEERKRELYRATLERHMDDRLAITPNAHAEVTRMRRRLGIDQAEHERLLDDVRRELSGEGRADAASAGTLVLGRYRVESLLGEGGGGRTYRATDTRLERDVALKEIEAPDPRARREALREARTLARVHHPRVVTVHEVHESGGRVYVVMELVAGGSLADALKRGPLPPERARAVLADVLAALDALHGTGLVHRDVKPSNVLLAIDGRAKLADLGLARAPHDVTAAGLGPRGTPSCMAPEQVLGLPVDARTDVYGAAALLYEALAGRSYLAPALEEGVLPEEAIVSTPPPLPLAGAPAWANAFLARGLAKAPDARPSSAREALTALEGDGTRAASAPPG